MLSGFGRYPRVESEVVTARGPDHLAAVLKGLEGFVARGNGRAYGDAAIGERATVLMRGLDRMRAFDPSTGRLEVEAGVMLADIVAAFGPRGFFPPVVPGTQHVTVGGMIAADVHGKNHHRDGGFGAHLEAMTLLLPDGSCIICSPQENADLFAATIGGMGLTGTIVTATFRLRRVETGWIRQRTVAAPDLAAALAALRGAANATYSVAWIDCLARGKDLGRSLVYEGEHATLSDIEDRERAIFPLPRRRRLKIPFDVPSGTLNRTTVGTFNALYHRRAAARAAAPVLLPFEAYFFPLDGLSDWNRLYGARGFVQHQCVVPTAKAFAVLSEILDRVARLGTVSPLAVLKQLGPGSGTMSFPLEGFTLALDLPARTDVFALLDGIDRLVAASGGRLYLAKDARQSRQTFEAGYPGLSSFRDIRRVLRADGRMTSRLSARLGL